MKIFLSGLESGSIVKYLLKPLFFSKEENVTKTILGDKFSKYNLLSYYYISKQKNWEYINAVKEHSDLVLIDSGAHSFQFGAKVNFDAYVDSYMEFIKKFDGPNVLGYFEMDIENIIGLEKVEEYRKKLETVTDKIIPVWHKNRGIDNYLKMCKDYAGKTIAIGGFMNTDILDEQYLMFLKEAKKYNCKVHCLGMTRPKILDVCPFDFTDSASWVNNAVYGRIKNKYVTIDYSKTHRYESFAFAFKDAIEIQEKYYKKWKNIK